MICQIDQIIEFYCIIALSLEDLTLRFLFVDTEIKSNIFSKSTSKNGHSILQTMK